MKIIYIRSFSKFSFVLLIIFLFVGESLAQGQFFREYWAEFDSTITPSKMNYWRVNDESVSLHEKYGHRKEPRANGLIMIPMDEDLFLLEKAELYLELWGGHKGTENKRFYLNGRGPYLLPITGVENGYYSFTFPTIPLKIENLVRGKNAFQFAIDKGKGGWGHSIVAQADLKCYLKNDHPDLLEAGLQKFDANVKVGSEYGLLNDITSLSLNLPNELNSKIDSVLYFGRYAGFDDQGLQKDNYWHGFTANKIFVNHVGSSKKAPYEVNWNTEMIPDQPSPMAVRAIVYFSNGIRYQTVPTSNLVFPKDRNTVRMYKCETLPKAFGSRMSKERTAEFTIWGDIENIEKAQLMVKNWGKHKGHNEGPFKLNEKPYYLFYDVVTKIFAFSRISINTEDLLPGKNIFSVFSDTEHHSLEIFLPGPVLFVKEKK